MPEVVTTTAGRPVSTARPRAKNPAVRWLYWRNFFAGFFAGLNQFDTIMTMMAFYMHFAKQREYILEKTASMGASNAARNVPRSVAAEARAVQPTGT